MTCEQETGKPAGMVKAIFWDNDGVLKNIKGVQIQGRRARVHIRTHQTGEAGDGIGNRGEDGRNKKNTGRDGYSNEAFMAARRDFHSLSPVS